jgi:hypothetical protein
MKNDDENRREPDAPPTESEDEDDRSRASTEVIDLSELQTQLDRCREDDAKAGVAAGRTQEPAPPPDEAPGELDLSRVPVMVTAPRDIRWHHLDHRAGFLLSRVDGKRTYASIITLSGMKHTDSVSLFLDLRAAKIITDRAGRDR